MSIKNIVLVIGLGVALIGCGSELPVVNSVNCSGGGMQSALPQFTTEADRKAFLDGCDALKENS